MTTSIIDYFPKQTSLVQIDKNERSLSCTILWRRNQLLVKPADYRRKKYIYTLDNKESLIDCLSHSPINLVRIEPQLGEEQLLFWANACQAANKPIYLCIPKADRNNQFLDVIQQLINHLLGYILFALLIPLILPMILFAKLYWHHLTITDEWYIGKRGRLFKKLKFSPTDISLLNESRDFYLGINKLMQKYGLDKIPQLLNVIRGEMILFGTTGWTLKDALQLSDTEKKKLNEIPAFFNIYSR